MHTTDLRGGRCPTTFMKGKQGKRAMELENREQNGCFRVVEDGQDSHCDRAFHGFTGLPVRKEIGAQLGCRY